MLNLSVTQIDALPPKPGDFGTVIQGDTLLVPRVVIECTNNNIRNAAEFYSIVTCFPSAFIDGLKEWKFEDVLTASEALKQQLTGHLDDRFLNPPPPPKVVFGALPPPSFAEEQEKEARILRDLAEKLTEIASKLRSEAEGYQLSNTDILAHRYDTYIKENFTTAPADPGGWNADIRRAWKAENLRICKELSADLPISPKEMAYVVATANRSQKFFTTNTGRKRIPKFKL